MPERIPADIAVQVVIARSSAALDLAPFNQPVIAVFPDYNDWNDYGRNFFAKLHVRTLDRGRLELHMRIMFEGAFRSAPVFDDLLKRNGDVFPIEAIDRPFVSLIPDVDGYRQVIDNLGFQVGVSALRKLKDAVVIRTEGEDEVGLRLIGDEEFHIGILRPNGAYDALRRGSRYFRPIPSEPVEDAVADFVFATRLKTADNPYTVPFAFNQRGLFRDRTAVLIGRNGVGKTRLLKAIVDGLHDGHTSGFVRPHFQPVVNPSRVLVFSSVPTDPFPPRIGAWHGIDYEYFAVNAIREEGTDPLLTALVACKKAEDLPIFGPKQDQSRLNVVEGALDRIGLWDRLHLPLRRRNEGEELPLVIDVEGQTYFPMKGKLNELNSLRLVQRIDWKRTAVVLNDQMEPRELSSGEYAMLRFAAQAAAAIEQGSLLLLDEPETHLHPNFVSDLMEVLDNLLQATKSIAIIATHSAYVVREAPRLRVNILSLHDRQISVDTPRLQTFGASIDTISQFVFGDTNLSHGFQRTLERWADEVGRDMGIETVIDKFGAELNPESLSFIARRLRQTPTAD